MGAGAMKCLACHCYMPKSSACAGVKDLPRASPGSLPATLTRHLRLALQIPAPPLPTCPQGTAAEAEARGLWLVSAATFAKDRACFVVAALEDIFVDTYVDTQERCRVLPPQDRGEFQCGRRERPWRGTDLGLNLPLGSRQVSCHPEPLSPL